MGQLLDWMLNLDKLLLKDRELQEANDRVRELERENERLRGEGRKMRE